MLDEIERLSRELRNYCVGWSNVLVGSQYIIPLNIIKNSMFIGNAQWFDYKKYWKCLDWGCGDGHLSYFLGKSGLDVNAYSFNSIGLLSSISEKLFTLLVPEHPHPSILPYKNDEFNSVFSMGVLEHVREEGGDELASLKEIHRILAPNGFFYIFHLPNKYSWIEFVCRTLSKMGLRKKYHHNYLYTEKDIIFLAKNANFTILEMGLYNLLPRNMFSRFGKIADNKYFVKVFCCIESSLSIFFRKFSQNYYVVLGKI